MARIDKLIDEIIKRAQDAANGMFASYPGKVQTELLNTYLTDEECIRQLIKAEYEYKKGLRDEFYNVRNIKGVRLLMFMDISSGTWPVMGGKDMRSIRPHKMYNRVYHAILWPLFLSVKRIDYLKANIEQAKTNLNDISGKKKDTKSDATLKLEKLFKNISAYQGIIKILADENLIDINTYKAKTGRGTKGTKERLSGVIKDLHPKGYLTRRPSDDEIRIMLQNTFDLEVSIDTITHCNSEIIKIPYFTQNTEL